MQDCPSRLPILFKPIRGEAFSSYLGRNACFYGLDASSLLMEIVNEGKIGTPRSNFKFCDHRLSPRILELLPKRLNTTKDRLIGLTLSQAYPELTDEELRYTGGVRNIDTLEDLYSGPLKKVWCGRCLMEDQVQGRDQYMRLLWSLGTSMFCSKHRLPLTSNCFDKTADPQFAYDGKHSVIICIQCGISWTA